MVKHTYFVLFQWPSTAHRDDQVRRFCRKLRADESGPVMVYEDGAVIALKSEQSLEVLSRSVERAVPSGGRSFVLSVNQWDGRMPVGYLPWLNSSKLTERRGRPEPYRVA